MSDARARRAPGDRRPSPEDAAFVAAADQDPYGIATEEGPTEGHVVNAVRR